MIVERESQNRRYLVLEKEWLLCCRWTNRFRVSIIGIVSEYDESLSEEDEWSSSVASSSSEEIAITWPREWGPKWTVEGLTLQEILCSRPIKIKLIIWIHSVLERGHVDVFCKLGQIHKSPDREAFELLRHTPRNPSASTHHPIILVIIWLLYLAAKFCRMQV